MNGYTSLSLAVIELRVAERTAELVTLRAWMASKPLSFDDFLEASNAAALLEQEVERWRVLGELVRSFKQ